MWFPVLLLLRLLLHGLLASRPCCSSPLPVQVASGLASVGYREGSNNQRHRHHCRSCQNLLKSLTVLLCTGEAGDIGISPPPRLLSRVPFSRRQENAPQSSRSCDLTRLHVVYPDRSRLFFFRALVGDRGRWRGDQGVGGSSDSGKNWDSENREGCPCVRSEACEAKPAEGFLCPVVFRRMRANGRHVSASYRRACSVLAARICTQTVVCRLTHDGYALCLQRVYCTDCSLSLGRHQTWLVSAARVPGSVDKQGSSGRPRPCYRILVRMAQRRCCG